MNYTEMIKALNQASLFDLYRLNVAINVQLQNPARNMRIKQQLCVGQEISYFDEIENRLIEATIVKLKKTRLLVKNKHDGKHWNIPFYWLNIDNVDATIEATSNHKIDRNSLRVGDKVCFRDKNGQMLVGDVYKLNPKTAGVVVGKLKWRVGYSLLSQVLDGESGAQPSLLKGEVIKRSES